MARLAGLNSHKQGRAFVELFIGTQYEGNGFAWMKGAEKDACRADTHIGAVQTIS
jgi:hypothetical protein